MIRCKEVAKLLTSDQLRNEGFWKRAEVRFHLWMCKYCARLERQIKQLRSSALQMAASTDAEKAGGASGDLEARLLRKLFDKAE